MSIEIMAAVWQRGPNDTVKRFVLLTLADYADQDGYCWPSYNTIAHRCSISRSTAIRAVKMLEVEGWLSRKARRKAGTLEPTSNGYFVDLERLGLVAQRHQGSSTAPPPSSTALPPSSTAPPGVVAQRYPIHQLDPLSDPLIDPSEEAEEGPPAATTAGRARLRMLGLGVNARTLELLDRPYFSDEYCRAMLEWAQNEGKSTGLAITRMLDGDSVPIDPNERRLKIPAEFADVVQR